MREIRISRISCRNQRRLHSVILISSGDIALKPCVEICQNEELFRLSLVLTSGVIYGEDH